MIDAVNCSQHLLQLINGAVNIIYLSNGVSSLSRESGSAFGTGRETRGVTDAGGSWKRLVLNRVRLKKVSSCKLTVHLTIYYFHLPTLQSSTITFPYLCRCPDQYQNPLDLSMQSCPPYRLHIPVHCSPVKRSSTG